jgi:hypothetical protein
MKSWQRSLKAFWSAEANPLAFFVVAYLVGISVNLASNWFQSYLETKNASILKAAIIIGIPGVVMLAMSLARLRTREEIASSHLQPATRARVLVVFASPGGGIDTARMAIKYHAPTLDTAWLICSVGGDVSSEAAAEALRGELERERFVLPGLIQILRLPNSKFEDPEAIRGTVQDIYEKLPDHLTERDVIIDITGGRKATTAGAFLAGLPKGRRLEVINPLATDESGHGTKPGDPVEIVIDYSLRRAKGR